MKAPAIILGDPNGILRLPKASLRTPENWTQMDSDVLAHFMQVQGQIQKSRWNKAKVNFAMKGHAQLEYSFPEFEDFVFAAVYLRQLIAKKDSLFEDAITRYCKFVDCPIRAAWIGHELKCFNHSLDRPAIMFQTHTVRQLFDAFMYGAGLLHKIPKVADQARKRFLEIYDKKPRHALFFSLHTSLKQLMNHVGAASFVIYRDYSHWLTDYALPAPDTRWHDRLFQVE